MQKEERLIFLFIIIFHLALALPLLLSNVRWGRTRDRMAACVEQTVPDHVHTSRCGCPTRLEMSRGPPQTVVTDEC